MSIKAFIKITCLLSVFMSVSVVAQEPPLNIGLIGDSTVASTYGWGPAFAKRFSDKAKVFNYAKNGATLPSLSKKLDELLELKPDYVLVQFGHNDQKKYDTEAYSENLKSYVERITRAEAKTIILSSVTRRFFDEDGKIKPRESGVKANLSFYAKAAQAVAQEEGVLFIDLNAISIEHHNQIGPEASVAYNFKETDTTHFSKQGAEAIATLVLTELQVIVPEIKDYLIESEAANAPWPGSRSSFHSFAQYDFEIEGIKCRVVVPDTIAAGKPWIWRARFWGHEPQTDIALLEKGFHVVYADVAGLYGSPQAVKRWDTFYQYLTETHGFDRKAMLEGMSRGGLIVYNWAAKNPDKVHCIYADAPVCDFKSWPGGKGASQGSEDEWQRCLAAYEMTESEALDYQHNPIDNLAALAQANIPLLHVVGDADQVVPVAENTAVMETRYQELGGHITVIHKADVGHHPHSLKDPGRIVEFILKHVRESNDLN